MQKKVLNPCTRCGRERIVDRTWEETIETFSGSLIAVHSMSVCPDPKCQKIVEERLAIQKAKYDDIKRNHEKNNTSLKIKNTSKRIPIKLAHP